MPDSRTNVCDRCKDEYDSYHVLIRDHISDITRHLTCEWDNLCKPCRMSVTKYGAYLTELELEELEPKSYMIDLYKEVNRIVDEIEEYDECDEEDLMRCARQARRGIDNSIQGNGLAESFSKISEMKGEWTIRHQREESETEREFAGKFIRSLDKAIRGES